MTMPEIPTNIEELEEYKEMADYILGVDPIEDRMQAFDINPDSKDADQEWEQIEKWAEEVNYIVKKELGKIQDAILNFKIDQYQSRIEDQRLSSPLVYS